MTVSHHSLSGAPLDLKRFFELVGESALIGTLIVDDTGAIRFVNHEVMLSFGYATAEMVAQPVGMLQPQAMRDEHAALCAGFATDPGRRMGAAVGRRPDGIEVPVEIGLNPIRTGHGPSVVASVADVSERRRLEQRLRDEHEDQSRFDGIVADVSAQFANVGYLDVDVALRDAQRRIIEALDLDRSIVWQRSEQGHDFLPTHVWEREDLGQIPDCESAGQLFPWVSERMRCGEDFWYSSVEDVPEPRTRENLRRSGMKASAQIAFSIGGIAAGSVTFASLREERLWSPAVIGRLRIIAQAFAGALGRKRSDAALHAALDEVVRLKDQLQHETVYLRGEMSGAFGSSVVAGPGAAMRHVMEHVLQVAATDATVLLRGETGTGKELLASKIHERSSRHDRLMVRVNCAAIPTTLVESELFGREKGAYTGALSKQVGRFELADRSTIFLDEVGDLPLDVQVKLLRVLENHQVERLGSSRPVAINTRIIAATHRDLEAWVAEGRFREDLYYRLNVFPIVVPPLRDRVEDIPPLVWRFVEEFSVRLSKHVDSISQETMARLQQYSWPGNIRELRNVIERAMIVSIGGQLTIELPVARMTSPKGSRSLVEVETEHIISVLTSSSWRIRGSAGAAARLGMKPSTLETRMAKLGIKRPATST